MRGIDTLDIESRVGLGISEPLRFGERLAKVRAGRFHFRQDVIAGAVEDAVNLGQRIGAGPFAQALHHRNPAGNRRFEFERRALGFGEFGKREAVVRDHRLVGSHDALVLTQRRTRKRQRRPVGAAHQLDHHIDILAPGELCHVVFPRITRKIDAAILGAITRAHRDHFDRAASAGCDEIVIGAEQTDHADADRAESGNRNAQRFNGSGRSGACGHERGPILSRSE